MSSQLIFSALFIGGVDLLLHLLTNIIELPVTKSVVKDSGMGKAIGSIEKHQICAGTLNETAVRERVDKIKAAWNRSVKALKEKVSIEQSSPSSRPRILPHCCHSSILLRNHHKHSYQSDR